MALWEMAKDKGWIIVGGSGLQSVFLWAESDFGLFLYLYSLLSVLPRYEMHIIIPPFPAR